MNEIMAWHYVYVLILEKIIDMEVNTKTWNKTHALNGEVASAYRIIVP